MKPANGNAKKINDILLSKRGGAHEAEFFSRAKEKQKLRREQFSLQY